jgi:choice-of-anchor C domain-containing protein
MAFKRTWIGAAVGSAFLVAGISSQASANLISDGDFSNPPGGASFTTINAGSNFGPWSVDTGSIDLIGGYWQSPTAGGGSVDLDGDSPGSISQTFTATAGSYLLSFFLSGNPDGSPQQKFVEVTVGSGDKTFSYTIGTNTHADMQYTPVTLPFDLAPGPATLIFTSLDSDTPFGPVIGGVDISATPLPATWSMLLAGFVGLGFVAYRGRGTNKSSQASAFA